MRAISSSARTDDASSSHWLICKFVNALVGEFRDMERMQPQKRQSFRERVIDEGAVNDEMLIMASRSPIIWPQD